MINKKHFQLDDAPDIMSKFLSILNDEAERIGTLDPEDRKPQDIKLAISCLSALTGLHKENRVEFNQLAIQIAPLPQARVQEIIEARRAPLLPKFTSKNDAG
jgi:hypothetical protein